MEGNPFARMAEVMSKKENHLMMYRGAVTMLSPLTIDVSGVTISGSELMLNADLVNSCSVGDAVLLLTADQQLFYAVCKVVSG